MEGDSPLRLLFWIFILILGSAFFASSEIALSSVNRIRIMGYADDGDKRAAQVLAIFGSFDKALTTILIGNNILHISCATLATLFVTRLWGSGAVAAGTVVTTLVVFLFAEMIPKTFAKACNEKWSLRIAGTLLFLMKILTPLSFVFSKLSEFLSRPFRKGAAEEPTVTEDELYDIIETIVEEGEIDQDEGELVQNALEFADTAAKEIYTPWYKVVRVNLLMQSDTVLDVIQSCAQSRLPVTGIEGTVVGILPIRSYLRAYLQDKDVTISEVMVDAHFVRTDMPIDELMRSMSESKTHMAVVLGENGETLGVVTMEDILEELVGEIYDEDDPEGGEGV